MVWSVVSTEDAVGYHVYAKTKKAVVTRSPSSQALINLTNYGANGGR
jgi:hypothetical protein